jgi:GNAT superfamily N-acetyltransferase
MPTPRFESPAGYGRDLAPEEVPLLQALLDANPEYFQTINGRNAHADEAQLEFDERPPPYLSYTQHFCIGLFEHGNEAALVGVAIVSADLAAAGVWHIGLFLVASRLHGKGQAGQLYQGLEAWIRRSGAVWLRLGVVQGNLKAERFWARQGYHYLRERRDVDTGGRLNHISVLLKPLGEAGIDEYLARVPRDQPGSELP